MARKWSSKWLRTNADTRNKAVDKIIFQLVKRFSVFNGGKIFTAPANTPLPPNSLSIISDIVTHEEEEAILAPLYPLLRFRYQGSHWDDVIVRYREIELNTDKHEVWSDCVNIIGSEVKKYHGPDLSLLPPHVVDLAADGHIGAHIDSVKFSGSIIAGLSLLSPRIMRLEWNHEAAAAAGLDVLSPPEGLEAVEFYLPPRSLYILSGPLRFFYSHQILGYGSPSNLPLLMPSLPSKLNRRISIVIRDEKVELK